MRIASGGSELNALYAVINGELGPRANGIDSFEIQ